MVKEPRAATHTERRFHPTVHSKNFSRVRPFAFTMLIGCLLVMGYASWKWIETAGGASAVFVDFGRFAPLVSVPVHVVLSATPFPSEMLGVASGALYGQWAGTFLSWLGWWLGAMLEYALVRQGVYDNEAPSKPRRLPTFLGGLAPGHPLFLIVGRQLPFGFHVVNITAGIAGVSCKRFALCAAVSNIPYAVLTAAAGAGLAAG